MEIMRELRITHNTPKTGYDTCFPQITNWELSSVKWAAWFTIFIFNNSVNPNLFSENFWLTHGELLTLQEYQKDRAFPIASLAALSVPWLSSSFQNVPWFGSLCQLESGLKNKWNEYQINEKHVSVAHNGFKRATTMCIFDNPNTIEIKLIRFSISVMPLRSILKRFRFQLPVWMAASIARVILFCSDFIDDITSTTCQKGVLI